MGTNWRLKGENVYLKSLDVLADTMIKNRHQKIYFALNTDCYNIARLDEQYGKLLNNAEHIIYIDGMGIRWGQMFTNGATAMERITTTDLFPALLKKSYRHSFYLIGGKPGVVECLIQKMQEQYPNAHFIGYHHGYFSSEEEMQLLADIKVKKPDFLFVGLGCPKQEKWVSENKKHFEAINIVTCGGLFDYYAENVKRAPLWMQKIGMEWFYRFLQEPKRLWKRYFLGNTKFIFHVVYLRITKQKIGVGKNK